VHAYSSGAIEESEASVSLYGVDKQPINFFVHKDGQVMSSFLLALMPLLSLSRAGAEGRLERF
jgi:hypothetical protein